MKQKKKRLSLFERCNYALFTFIAVLMVFPIWNVLVISISDYKEYVENPLMLFPKTVTFAAYRQIFSTSELLNSFGISVFITVVGTAISMAATIGASYALSKKKLPGRSIIFMFIVITMFFNGGMIPTFLLVKNVGLYDKVWSMILPTAVNTWYLIIMKNFFASLPEALEESARIDGAGVFRILWSIVIPVSTPIIATITLFYGVEKWNEWWNAMLYLNDAKLFPLQLVLRNLIVKDAATSSMLASYIHSGTFVAKESTKMATAIVAILPITVVYPFLQKYFAQGIMVGSIKS